uniref:Uncharacterized protein n=1 Tax=Glossina austeni TaxID=7395 RepID=A0A1A9UHZ8_GLOAU
MLYIYFNGTLLFYIANINIFNKGVEIFLDYFTVYLPVNGREHLLKLRRQTLAVSPLQLSHVLFFETFSPFEGVAFAMNFCGAYILATSIYYQITILLVAEKYCMLKYVEFSTTFTENSKDSMIRGTGLLSCNENQVRIELEV